MAWENRDYYRQQQDGYPGGGWRSHIGGFRAGSMILILLAINVLVFLIDIILRGSPRGDFLAPFWWGYFSVDTGILSGQIWRLVTYQFLHGNFFHLLFNMIGLYIFGQYMERWWGSRRFIAFYLLCGIGGALLYSLVAMAPAIAQTDSSLPLVGASGCILGLVIGCVLKFPREQIGLLLLPFTFTMKMLGTVYIGLDLLQVLAGGPGAGSAVAHLGGVAVGAVLVTWPWLLGWADRVDVEAAKASLDRRRRLRAQQTVADEQAQVDRILDKVKNQGLHSLTRREKKTLNRATERQRRAG